MSSALPTLLIGTLPHRAMAEPGAPGSQLPWLEGLDAGLDSPGDLLSVFEAL